MESLSLKYNLLITAVAAAVVWFAGYRLAKCGDAVAKKTGAGEALVGTVLLGVMVSLPEMTFASVSAAFGQAELAVNGLVGGISMTMIMVAITDVVVGRESLSRDVQHPVVLLQAAMTLLMLVVAAAAITTGDRLLPGIGLVGLWTTLLLVIYVITLVLVRHVQRRHPWRPTSEAPDGRKSKRKREDRSPEERKSLRTLSLQTALAPGLVLVAGSALAFAAESINQQTAIGAGLIGLIFGGLSTSLPELSTTIAAARMKEYELAYSDAFGTNLCSTALLFIADLVYPGGPILNEVGTFATFSILLGAALTSIYLVGLVVRHERAYLRMGLDSAAVLAAATGGFALLYFLK